MIQYLNRLSYPRLRPASWTSKHGWPTKTELIIVTTGEATSRQEILSLILMIHPLCQVWNHAEILCLFQPVASMYIWNKIAKMWTISYNPSVKVPWQTHDWNKWNILQWNPILIIATCFYMLPMDIQCRNYKAARIMPLTSRLSGGNMNI